VGDPQISSIDLKNMSVSKMSDVLSPTENDHCHAFILYEAKSSLIDINQEKQHFVFSCDSEKDRNLWVFTLANEIHKSHPKDKSVSDLVLTIPRRSSSKELADSRPLTKNELPPSGISQIADLVGEIKLPFSKKKTETQDVKNTKGKKYFKSISLGSAEKNLPQVKRIFGCTLSDAVEISQISKNLPIPAVVYRCIEYLEFKKGSFLCLMIKSGKMKEFIDCQECLLKLIISKKNSKLVI
jgi:hypothetical protein